MRDPDIVRKIRKLMALAGNNPSKDEAIAAAAKAQKLMAENGIDHLDDDDFDSIDMVEITTTKKEWRKKLAHIIAVNFRCQSAFSQSGVVFFGYPQDRQICGEVFESLYQIGNSLGNLEVRLYKAHHPRRKTTGIFEIFINGFLSGLNSQLARQAKALMLVVPEEVTKFAAVRVHTAKARPDNLRRRISKAVKDDYDSIFRRGYSEGQAAVARPIGENR